MSNRVIFTKKPRISRDVRSRWGNGKYHRPTAKGHTVETKVPVWVEINGYQNLVYKGQDDDYYINITNIKRVLADLRPYADTRVEDLPANLKAEYDDILQSLHMTRGTASYPVLYEVVLGVFKDLESVKPMTVGGYFAGCFIPSNYPGEHACSDACAGSLLPPSGTEGFSPCQDAVVIYNGAGSYNNLDVPKGAKNMIVFVQNPSTWTGFSNDDIRYFKQLGIENATVLVVQGDNYQKIADKQPVGTLPREGTLVVAEALSRDVNQTTQQSTTNDSSAGLWWVFGFIIIAIIIILIALAVASSRRQY